jgi:hypothetical protein
MSLLGMPNEKVIMPMQVKVTKTPNHLDAHAPCPPRAGRGHSEYMTGPGIGT